MSKFLWFLLHVAILSYKEKKYSFFLIAVISPCIVCVLISVPKLCFLFRATPWILEDATTSWPHPLTIPEYGGWGGMEMQTSPVFAKWRNSYVNWFSVPVLFCVSRNVSRRELWACSHSVRRRELRCSGGKALPSRRQQVVVSSHGSRSAT